MPLPVWVATWILRLPRIGPVVTPMGVAALLSRRESMSAMCSRSVCYQSEKRISPIWLGRNADPPSAGISRIRFNGSRYIPPSTGHHRHGSPGMAPLSGAGAELSLADGVESVVKGGEGENRAVHAARFGRLPGRGAPGPK